MKTKTKRTLVKSAPELWECADDLERMEAWMAGLMGADGPVPVEITKREPERRLAWRSVAEQNVRIAIELAESGWGTAVSITAHNGSPERVEAAVERLLDELGSPERRPFSARGST